MHGTIGHIATGVSASEVQQARPQFKPRWWHRADRLDARPVIWSLLNRPGEWEWSRYALGFISGNRIRHTPSEHEFWVGSGRGYYRLYRADCSCTSEGGRFQPFQQRAFHRAFCIWRSAHPLPVPPRNPIDPEQFANHFIHSDAGTP